MNKRAFTQGGANKPDAKGKVGMMGSPSDTRFSDARFMENQDAAGEPAYLLDAAQAFSAPGFLSPMKVPVIALVMDFENTYIAMKERGYPLDPAVLMRVLRAVLRNYGEIYNPKCYADYGMLDPINGLALQKKLADEGVDVIYLSNKRGKNSADMRIVRDVRDQLEGGPYAPHQFDVLALVSGDRDFTDLISSVRERNKPVVVLSFRGSLSRDLERSAAKLIYLDEYFIHQRVVPNAQGARAAVHAVVLALRQKADQFTGPALRQSLGGSNAEREIKEAIEQTILLADPSTRRLAANAAHPLVKAASFLAAWVPEKIQEGLRRQGFTYVDTNYLVNGAKFDQRLCGLGILGGRPEMEAWLALLAEAGYLRKAICPAAKDPTHMVDTWWPVV